MSGKKRGMSLDEKRDALMTCFYETKDVFQLKEVEKMGSKKGIPLQNVKEILTTLIDDNMVHLEKIGSSNYYWSFPSEAGNKVKLEERRLRDQVAEMEARAAKAEALKAELSKGRESSDEREQNMELLGAMEHESKKMRVELAEFAENDPEALENIQKARRVAKESANRWLDNAWTLRDWCRNKFEGREDELNSFFKSKGLTDDLDYLP